MAMEKKIVSLTFRSGFAISGSILQNGLITSKNLTKSDRKKKEKVTIINQHSVSPF